MSYRESKKTGIRYWCTNIEVPDQDYQFLVMRAKRRKLAGRGNKTGVSRLLKLEISRVVAEEREMQRFYMDSKRPSLEMAVIVQTDQAEQTNA